MHRLKFSASVERDCVSHTCTVVAGWCGQAIIMSRPTLLYIMLMFEPCSSPTGTIEMYNQFDLVTNNLDGRYFQNHRAHP